MDNIIFKTNSRQASLRLVNDLPNFGYKIIEIKDNYVKATKDDNIKNGEILDDLLNDYLSFEYKKYPIRPIYKWYTILNIVMLMLSFAASVIFCVLTVIGNFKIAAIISTIIFLLLGISLASIYLYYLRKCLDIKDYNNNIDKSKKEILNKAHKLKNANN